MPGLHCDDLGHLCLHKQETDTSKFLGCSSILLGCSGREWGESWGMYVCRFAEGCNHGFWSHLGCSGRDVTIFNKLSRLLLGEEIIKKPLCQFKRGSYRDQKSSNHTHIGLL